MKRTEIYKLLLCAFLVSAYSCTNLEIEPTDSNFENLTGEFTGVDPAAGLDAHRRRRSRAPLSEAQLPSELFVRGLDDRCEIPRGRDRSSVQLSELLRPQVTQKLHPTSISSPQLGHLAGPVCLPQKGQYTTGRFVGRLSLQLAQLGPRLGEDASAG